MKDKSQKIPVGISSCLLGEKVRYNGGHKKNAYIVETLGEYFEFLPFCPEMDIGLGTPREPVRLVRQGQEVRCVGTHHQALDVTGRLVDCANRQAHWHSSLSGYILKKDSPSCGMQRVKLYHKQQVERSGVGIYARQMRENFPNLPVEEEGRLGDARLRENFIQRVFVYHRWRGMVAEGLTWKRLTDFHARHKLTLMSRNQQAAKALGRALSQAGGGDIDTFARFYISELMSLLSVIASRENHVNVLQHIQGYLKKELDKDDKEELTQTIEQYRLGLIPLIVPITLLRHHFRKCPDDYIDQSVYMHPYPQELMLLNHL